MIRDLWNLLLGYAPRNRRVVKPLLPQPTIASYGSRWTLPMNEHPVRSLHHIRRGLDEIVSSLRRAIKRKDFRQMTLDLSALAALGARIDAVSAIVQTDLSGEAGSIASAVSSAISATEATNQVQVNTAISSLTAQVSSLEVAAGISSSLPSVSSSLPGVSSSLSGVSTSLPGVSTSLTPPPVLSIDPTLLPNAVVGQAYSGSITTHGGVGPFTFSVSTGALPDGLSLDAAGNITGTPSDLAVSQTFTVTAVDTSTGASASATETITI